jgi:hypothetical protein
MWLLGVEQVSTGRSVPRREKLEARQLLHFAMNCDENLVRDSQTLICVDISHLFEDICACFRLHDWTTRKGPAPRVVVAIP